MKTTGKQEQEFLEVLKGHQALIFRVANSYCRDPESRKDLIQEITLQL